MKYTIEINWLTDYKLVSILQTRIEDRWESIMRLAYKDEYSDSVEYLEEDIDYCADILIQVYDNGKKLRAI